MKSMPQRARHPLRPTAGALLEAKRAELQEAERREEKLATAGTCRRHRAQASR